MILRDIMLADLDRTAGIVRAGNEVVPCWRVRTPEGERVILTKFDPDRPEQRDRVLALLPRYMAWRQALGFIMTGETWLGPERTRSGEEALLSIGVSHHEQLAAIRRIIRSPKLHFGLLEWLGPDSVDAAYRAMLPTGAVTLSAEEIGELRAIFGPHGEMPERGM